MITVTLRPGLKRRFQKAVATQPETIFDGNNWEGTTYSLNDADRRRQKRILERLDVNGSVSMSRADWEHLYAAAHYEYSRAHPYQAIGHYGNYETFYRPAVSTYWRNVQLLVKETGITKRAAYHKAWGAGREKKKINRPQRQSR